MRLVRLFKTGAFAAVFCAAASTASAQGKVVVSHDEWFTGVGYFGSQEQQFVGNIANWFGMGSGSSVLIYSNDGFLTNSAFTNWLTAKGFNVTVNNGATSFAGYNAVFTEANSNLYTTGSSLTSYVFGGGNVLDIGGTGDGGEAAYNNTFLNNFGLSFFGSYNGVGVVNTSAYASQGPFGAALFTGVSSVFGNNGNDVLVPTAVAGVTNQVFFDGTNGVFGAAEVVTATPEPGTVALFSTGLLGLVPMVRRRRRSA